MTPGRKKHVCFPLKITLTLFILSMLILLLLIQLTDHSRLFKTGQEKKKKGALKITQPTSSCNHLFNSK